MPTTLKTVRPPTPNIPALNALAVRGLVSMFNEEKQLFCHRLVRTEHGLVQDGVSPRYTIMTLLGLREFERLGGNSPFDTDDLYNSFVRDIGWIDGVGDLGLTIWLTATFAPDRLTELFRRVDLDTALTRYADARQARTTELAWFVAGLAHAGMTSPQIATELTDLAVETFHRLEENQGECGFWGHMCKEKSWAGFLRGRIGSFADQIYSVYAMAKFATAFHIEEPLSGAFECAMAICRAQGELGQWWWLYDADSGRTSSRYPVYSVHQQGMAPMGLFALEEATGHSFTEQIHKGLRWIYGQNELGVDVRDLEHNLVWRCILSKSKQTKYWDTMLSVLRSPKLNAPVGPLKILHEDRPYELGWLLYAFAKFNSGESEFSPPSSPPTAGSSR
jgi:hypothetical protein